MQSLVQYVASPVGTLKLGTDGNAITDVVFAAGKKPTESSHPILKRCAKELKEYFAGKRSTFDVPLCPEGTPFQLAVWDAMSEVASGKTASYAEIARKAGHPKAVRAVGSACKVNPIAVIVPCHRVVASHGIGGYNGGLDRKRWLLKHEGA